MTAAATRRAPPAARLEDRAAEDRDGHAAQDRLHEVGEARRRGDRQEVDEPAEQDRHVVVVRVRAEAPVPHLVDEEGHVGGADPPGRGQHVEGDRHEEEGVAEDASNGRGEPAS
jgi:hypothetical protein